MERPDEHLDHLLETPTAAKQHPHRPISVVTAGGVASRANVPPPLEGVHVTPRSAFRGPTSFAAHRSDSLSPAYNFNLPEADGTQARDPLFAYTPSKDGMGPLNLESRLSPNIRTSHFRFSTPTNASVPPPPHPANKESHPVSAAVLDVDAPGSTHHQAQRHAQVQGKVHQQAIHRQPQASHPNIGYQHRPQHPQPQQGALTYTHLPMHNATQMAQMGIAQMHVAQSNQAHRPPSAFHHRKPNPDMVGLTAAHPQHAPHLGAHMAQHAAYIGNTYPQYLAPPAQGLMYMWPHGEIALLPAIASVQGIAHGSQLPSQHPATAVSGVNDVQPIVAMHPTRQKEEKKATAAASKCSRSKQGSNHQLKRTSPEETVRLAATMERPPTRKSSKGGGWCTVEDDMLRVVVIENDTLSWKTIAKSLNKSFPGSNRSYEQCFNRWHKVLEPGLKKGSWAPGEDSKLAELVAKEGGANQRKTLFWSNIAENLPGRVGKQCRERWFNQLDPEIKKEPWTKEEEEKFMILHAKFGNKWVSIARELPGRTENAIKNRYYAIQRRERTKKSDRNVKRRTNDDANRTTGNAASKSTPTTGSTNAVLPPPDLSMTSASNSGSNNSSQSPVGSTVPPSSQGTTIAPSNQGQSKRKTAGATSGQLSTDELDMNVGPTRALSLDPSHLPPSKRLKCENGSYAYAHTGNNLEYAKRLGELPKEMLTPLHLREQAEMDKENGILHASNMSPPASSRAPRGATPLVATTGSVSALKDLSCLPPIFPSPGNIDEHMDIVFTSSHAPRQLLSPAPIPERATRESVGTSGRVDIEACSEY